MHKQSTFKVTWTPHDHRMITWLTSESLQTQALGHLVTEPFPRVVTRPHGSSHDQTTYHRHTTELMLISWCDLVRTVSITADAAIRIDLCDFAESVYVTHAMEFFLRPVPRYLSHMILGTRTAGVN